MKRPDCDPQGLVILVHIAHVNSVWSLKHLRASSEWNNPKQG